MLAFVFLCQWLISSILSLLCMGKKSVLICWLSIKETIRLTEKCLHVSLLELAGSSSLSPLVNTVGCPGSRKGWRREVEQAFPARPALTHLRVVVSPRMFSLWASSPSSTTNTTWLFLHHTLEKRPLTSSRAQRPWRPNQTQNQPRNSNCSWRHEIQSRLVVHPGQISSQGPHPEASTAPGTW